MDDKGGNLPTFLGVPAGGIRDVASFIYCRAPYPNETIALAAAIAFNATLSGRSHNVNGVGLNQYIFTVANTGTGKEQGPDGIARLMTELERTHPLIGQNRGPGEIVSAPGLHKALANRKNPSMLCIIGEVGLMVTQLASPKRDPIKVGIERMLLHVYTKGAYGAVLDDAAYSDLKNNPGLIYSPNLNILGDTTGETFYAAMDERVVQSGLLPRFEVFETNEPRPYQNQNRVLDPCPQLIERLRRICTASLDLQASNRVCNVEMTAEARKLFVEFEKFTTDKVNGSENEIGRHLWTRVNLKALKLAATNAVSVDPLAPCITVEECMWATNLIVDQTNALIAKFKRGEVGSVAGNEIRQQEEVRHVFRECIDGEYGRLSNYRGTPEMHKLGVVTHSYISNRLLNMPLFRDDPSKATPAIKRAIDCLMANDEIEKLPYKELWEYFGCKPTAYRYASTNSKAAFTLAKPHPLHGIFDGV